MIFHWDENVISGVLRFNIIVQIPSIEIRFLDYGHVRIKQNNIEQHRHAKKVDDLYSHTANWLLMFPLVLFTLFYAERVHYSQILSLYFHFSSHSHFHFTLFCMIISCENAIKALLPLSLIYHVRNLYTNILDEFILFWIYDHQFDIFL